MIGESIFGCRQLFDLATKPLTAFQGSPRLLGGFMINEPGGKTAVTPIPDVADAYGRAPVKISEFK